MVRKNQLTSQEEVEIFKEMFGDIDEVSEEDFKDRVVIELVEVNQIKKEIDKKDKIFRSLLCRVMEVGEKCGNVEKVRSERRKATPEMIKLLETLYPETIEKKVVFRELDKKLEEDSNLVNKISSVIEFDVSEYVKIGK